MANRLMHGGCFVVKNTSTVPSEKPMKWLVATDDSDYAMKAIKDTKSLMKDGDTLLVFMPTACTVGMKTSGSEIDTFKERKTRKYEQMCDEFTFLLKDSGVSVADTILKHIEDKDIDVLVIAHRGLTYSYTAKPGDKDAKVELGSTATGACAAAAELLVRDNDGRTACAQQR